MLVNIRSPRARSEELFELPPLRTLLGTPNGGALIARLRSCERRLSCVVISPLEGSTVLLLHAAPPAEQKIIAPITRRGVARVSGVRSRGFARGLGS